MNKIDRIKELVELLDKASDAYYNTGNTIMEDKEFDGLLDELKSLEEDTGFILSVSPTQNVGYEVKSKLDKVKHNHLMLSLDKTKDVDDVIDFLSGRDSIIMAKMDGLTCSLRYLNGELVSAETRGNGEIGEDILHCAKVIKNIPLKIDRTDEVIVDGEVIITIDDFQEINSKLPEDKKYKNPRNLASGSIRQLDSKIAAQRNMKFIAWKFVKGSNEQSFLNRLIDLIKLGFDIVPCIDIPVDLITAEKIRHVLVLIRDWAYKERFPIDGCVFGFDDIAYGESLGATGHHLKSQLAYKFYDETYETELLDIEWTVGRSGTITPTAVFKPVEIDGTMVERASVHNVSVLTQLDLHASDIIEVCKSNQIIPQIKRNISAEQRIDTDYIVVPATCPICGGVTKIIETDNSKILICTNPDCAAKKLAQFVHFVSRNCMNIVGMSEATLERLLSLGFLDEYADIYRLKEHYGQLVILDGFGTKSVDKLLNSIEESRCVKLENFIAALGIPNIGLSAAKTISKACDGSWDKLYDMWNNQYDFTRLDDVGEVMADSLNYYITVNNLQIKDLLQEINFITPEKVEIKENPFTGKSLCITGKLNHFTRNSINEKIALLGAKAVSSVSSKTDYLITNEASGSSKYKKAIELNIPIITEDEFLNMIGE